jgi:hypothetical protein
MASRETTISRSKQSTAAGRETSAKRVTRPVFEERPENDQGGGRKRKETPWSSRPSGWRSHRCPPYGHRSDEEAVESERWRPTALGSPMLPWGGQPTSVGGGSSDAGRSSHSRPASGAPGDGAAAPNNGAIELGVAKASTGACRTQWRWGQRRQRAPGMGAVAPTSGKGPGRRDSRARHSLASPRRPPVAEAGEAVAAPTGHGAAEATTALGVGAAAPTSGEGPGCRDGQARRS